MPAGDRRFDRSSSNLVIFGVAVAVAVLAYQPTLDVPSADRAARIVEVAPVKSGRRRRRKTIIVDGMQSREAKICGRRVLTQSTAPYENRQIRLANSPAQPSRVLRGLYQ